MQLVTYLRPHLISTSWTQPWVLYQRQRPYRSIRVVNYVAWSGVSAQRCATSLVATDCQLQQTVRPFST